MKILVIRFLAIGDVVITSSLCSSLRKSFPHAQIDYLVHEASGCLFQYHPDINNTLTISVKERKNPIRYFRRIWEISQNRYDIIIDTSSTAKSEFVSLFSRQCKFRIGRKKRGRGFSYTHKISASELTGDKISQRMAMLKPLEEIGFPIKYVNNMKLYLTEIERMQLKVRMRNSGVDFDRPVFAFAVSAKETQKKWCLDYMKDVIQHCLEKYQAQIILFSGLPHEKKDIDNIHRLLGKHKDVFSDIPSDGLRELAALLSNCDIFIGNEGGPRHIAHALGLPSATVFSPQSSHQEWLPNKGKHHQGVEWQDVASRLDSTKPEFNYGDSTYYQLYNTIKPADVIPMVDKVIAASL